METCENAALPSLLHSLARSSSSLVVVVVVVGALIASAALRAVPSATVWTVDRGREGQVVVVVVVCECVCVCVCVCVCDD